MMGFSKWLNLMGSVFLLVGLLTAFFSSHYTTQVMGEARKGVAVFAPEPSSSAWQEKEQLLWWADFWFYAGLVLTAVGVVLQTIRTILPIGRKPTAST